MKKENGEESKWRKVQGRGKRDEKGWTKNKGGSEEMPEKFTQQEKNG